MEYNIMDYGAVNDGKTLCTASIQSAIDGCAVSGGRVLIPAGVYVTGTIRLKSNVELHLCHGAKLIASSDLKDYNEADEYEQNFSSKVEKY